MGAVLLDRAWLTWVVTAYTLCFGGLLLLGGRLADTLGRRRTFLAGLGLFTAELAVGAGDGGDQGRLDHLGESVPAHAGVPEDPLEVRVKRPGRAGSR